MIMTRKMTRIMMMMRPSASMCLMSQALPNLILHWFILNWKQYLGSSFRHNNENHKWYRFSCQCIIFEKRGEKKERKKACQAFYYLGFFEKYLVLTISESETCRGGWRAMPHLTEKKKFKRSLSLKKSLVHPWLVIIWKMIQR